TVAGQLFVQIQDPTLGDALLVTDGTTNGTRRLSIPPRPQSSYSVPVALGRELVLFRSKSGRPGIFATDGFAVRFVRDLPGTAVGGEPVRLGERIVFSIHGGLADRVELWSTDATASGTQQLLTFAAILGLKRWRDRVWFLARANSTTGPIELWSTDGTAANTAPFARLSTSPYGYSLVATRERLFALAMDTLLAFDGVSPSPVMIRSPIGWIERANARSVGERLVFEVKSGAIPGQSVLWSSDGTTSGTTPISSPYQRWSSSTGTTLIPIGARHALFITENAGTWITDGTASGTRFFWDRFVLDGEIPYYERSLNAANGLAWVSAYDPVFGQEPYVIDLDSSIEPLSRGCGGLDREAELFASLGPAPLGGLTVEGRSSAGGMALVFLSAPPLRPTPLPSAGRCVLDVDPNAHVVLIQTPLTSGRFARTWPLPADAALRGVQATLQAAIAPTDAPLGFDLSNGLLVNLWR
ncbi:MAG: hypothetical protein HZB39_02365, partial [Planctomycetes bacterium]|nr:hypothetical protein [Planctomycetota bacterium]